MNRNQLVSAFFVVLLLFILYNVGLIFLPFSAPLFWAAIIAFTFYPIYQKVSRGLKNNHWAAILTTLAIFLAIVPIILVVTFSLVQEGGKFYQFVQQSIQNGEIQNFFERLRSHALVRRLESIEFLRSTLLTEKAQEWALGLASMIGNFSLKYVGIWTKSFFLGFVDILLTLFILFFFFRDGEKMIRFVYALTPLEEDTKQAVFSQLGDTFSAVIRGQLFTGLVQGTILGLVFWALGLPLPILFAALTFLTGMIPVLGAASVWVPFVGYLAVSGHYAKAVILLIMGAGVISLVDNILKPILIGEKTKLPYFLLFLGILGGLHVYGFMGIFLAPAVLSLFFVLARIFRQKVLLADLPQDKA